MAASKAEMWTQLRYLIKLLDETYKFCAANTPNFLSLEDLIKDNLAGMSIGETQSALTSYRDSLNYLLLRKNLLSSTLIELAKVGYNYTVTSATDALAAIYLGMVAATETVKGRAFTFGSVSAGGANVGTGSLLRVTVDKNNHNLEGGCWQSGAVKCLIIKDFSSGKTSGQEDTVVYGNGVQQTDELDVGYVSAESISLTVKKASNGLLTNGDFETQSGTAPAITVSGWTLSTAANFDTSTAAYFRGTKALKYTANANILQYLSILSLNHKYPVMAAVRFNREAGVCDGTLTLRLGTKTEAVVLSAQTGWNSLILGTTTPTDVWYDNFREDYTGEGLRVQLTLSGRTTGYLLVDEFVMIQPTPYDGKFLTLLAGATDFLKDDFFTFTDSAANTGRVQSWISRLFGKYLPHTSGTPTYADL